MSDVLIRTVGSRYIVAEPTPRERRGEPAIATRRVRWHATPEDALRDAIDRIRHPRASGSAEASQERRARAHARLKPQARRAIRLMKTIGGLTRLDAMRYGIGNLPARIGEIREALGAESVESVDVEGEPYCRYVWRGPDSVQVEIGA